MEFEREILKQKDYVNICWTILRSILERVENGHIITGRKNLLKDLDELTSDPPTKMAYKIVAKLEEKIAERVKQHPELASHYLTVEVETHKRNKDFARVILTISPKDPKMLSKK